MTEPQPPTALSSLWRTLAMVTLIAASVAITLGLIWLGEHNTGIYPSHWPRAAQIAAGVAFLILVSWGYIHQCRVENYGRERRAWENR